MLTFANAQTSNRRRDLLSEYREPLKEDVESDKIRDFAQIVGIGSVLVSTATFTAALTMPGVCGAPVMLPVQAARSSSRPRRRWQGRHCLPGRPPSTGLSSPTRWHSCAPL